MKNIILLFSLLFTSLILVGQPLTADSSAVVGRNPTYVAQAGISATTSLGSESYTVTLTNRTELLGISTFIASNVQIGDIIVDANGGIYEVRSGSFPTVTVKLLNDPANLPEPFFGFPAAPTPPVIIARPTEPYGFIPSYNFLGQGVDPRLIAIISNYNANQTASIMGSNVSAEVTALQTLSGVAALSTDLGTFTGTTILDGSDNKAALQALETAVEAGGGEIDTAVIATRHLVDSLATALGVDISNLDYALADLVTLTGVPINSTTLGTFPIPGLGIDNTDIKTAIFILALDAFLTDLDKSNTNEGRLSLLPTYSGPDIDRVALRSNTSGTKDIVFVPGTGMKYIVSTVSGSQDSLTIINDAPDVPVTITDSGVATVSGTYPNFNVDVPAPTAATTSATPHGAVTGTNVQAQLEQLRALIPGVPVSGSNVLFVSKGTGNNATAQVGSSVLPFADPWAARDTAILQGIVNPVIFVQDGRYRMGTGLDKNPVSALDGSFYRPGFVYYCNPGVIFSNYVVGNVNNISFFTCVDSLGFTGGDFSFLGAARLEKFVTGRLGVFRQANANIKIEVASVGDNSSGPSFFYIRRLPGETIPGRAFKFTNKTELIIGSYTPTSNGTLITFGESNANNDTIINSDETWKIGLLNNNSGVGINYGNLFLKDGVHTIEVEKGVVGTGGAALASIHRIGLINSTINFGVADFRSSAVSLGGQLFNVASFSDQKASLNGKINIRIDAHTGNLKNSWRRMAGTCSVLVDMNTANNAESSLHVIDNESMAGIDFTFKTKAINYQVTDCVIAVNNINSPVRVIESFVTGASPLVKVTNASRTASLNVYNTIALTTNPCIVTSNTVPINVAQSNFTLTDAGLKNIIREREIGEPIWRSNTFTATAAQSTYTTTPAKLPASGANLVVLVNGSEQIETTHYTYVPATGVVTWVTPFAGGESVKIRWYD